MKYETDILFKKWKDLFCGDSQWTPYLVFGPRSPIPRGDTKPIKKKINENKAFQKKLLLLARSYNFDPENPTYIQYSTSVLGNTGKIHYYVAESLLNTYKKCLAADKDLNIELNKIMAGNKSFHKGRISIPDFFAKHILIGLELFKDSDDGLKLIKQFIEPNGQLQQWLEEQTKNNGSLATTKKDLLSWVAAVTGETGNLKSWVYSKKQTLERIVLSRQLLKNIKNIDECEQEVTMLRGEVRTHSETIKTSINHFEV